MKEENYKRACEIKDRLFQLEIHGKELEKNHFMDTPGRLTYRYNDYHSEIKLFPELMPKDFFDAYTVSLEMEMERLQEEFNDL